MRTKSFTILRPLLIATATLASGAVGLSSAVTAQTSPLTTTTNQNSQVNPAATWTHPYWGVETLCSDSACNPVIPALNPNQNSPLGSIYDYYAYSPPVTKFVDPLPTVSIAVPDQNKYPGSDYYELSVEDYKFQFHKEMGPAVLRGYQQTNDTSGYAYAYTGSDGVPHSWPLAQLHQNNAGYAGPQIINVRNTPTRVKMTNNKSITGSAAHTYPDGSTGPSGLQIPVDETMPGAGSGPPVHLTTGTASYHATAGSYVNNANSGSLIYHTAGGTAVVNAAAGGPVSYVTTTTRLSSVHAASGGPVTYVNGTQTLNSVHATANANGVSYVTTALPSVHAAAGGPVSYATTALPSVHAAAGGPVSYVTNTKQIGATTYQQYAACSALMQAVPGLCTTVPAWTAYSTCSPVPGRVNCTSVAQYANCNAAEIGAGICTTVPAWTAYSTCSPVPGRITCTAVAQYAACNAAEIGAGICTTVPAWSQYSACSPVPGRVTCSNVTFNANATCTAAEQAAGVNCTTVPAWTADSPCTAVPGRIACSNPTVAAGTACSSTLQAIPGLCTTIPAWTANSPCTPNAVAGIVCTSVTFTANTICDPTMTGNPAFLCKSVSWTALSPCTPIGSLNTCTTSTWVINAVCTAPQSTVAGFACTNVSWTAGDYCTVAQVDNTNYSCTAGDYSFDRALLHEHGGNTPWISDGTPHQWTTPVGDTTSPYKRGLSNFNIPDMECAFNTATNTDTCPGVNTYFYTNQNSARMMWYHDHSYALTRLNVYNGELSLYFVTDPIEQAMLGKSTAGNVWDNLLASVGLATDTQTPTAAGAIQTYQPDNRFGDTLGTTLAIQDKTFVWGYDNNPNFGAGSAAAHGANLSNPITTQYKDSLWSSACGKHPASTTDLNSLLTFAGGNYSQGPFGAKDPCPTDTGSLWFPHVYSSNTDPNTGATVSGGRWDFGPWVYPAATIYSQYLPTVSAVPESFLDTIVTNGKAYPYMNVPRKPMRFRIINSSNERYLNLQLYYAVNNSGVSSGVTSTGTANPFAFKVDPTTVCNTGGNTDAAAPLGTAVTTHNYANCTEVGMILQNGSQKTGAYLVPIPAYIKPPAPCTLTNLVDCAANADGSPYSGSGQVYIPANTGTWQHFGGVPDPSTQVPFIQIGNEGGFLPFPIVHYSQTTEIETDPRNITLANVRNNPVANPPTCPGCVLPYPGYALAMGPAERADIIIDFGSIPDGATLILYNDMIAPNPGYDQRYDLFTGDSDMTAINGPRSTRQGQGPNTRTIMQFRVDGTINFPNANTTDPVTGLASFNKPLPANWVEEVNPYGNVYNPNDARPIPSASTATLNAALAAAFAASHVDPQVSASATTTTAPRTTPDGLRNYHDGTPYYMGAVDPQVYLDLTSTGVSSGLAANACDGSDGNLAGCATSRLCTYGDSGLCTGGITEFPTCATHTKNPLSGKIDNSGDPNYRKTCGFPVFTKAIAEDFDPPSGRLNAMLGNETTSLEANGQQTYGFPFVEPITERLHEGETQIWQVIHNGIDTHTIHFHLMNVQVINRIDWAGIPKLPDAEERGWKEVVKFQPLETTVVAVRMNRPGRNYDHSANNPPIPFTVPTSYRVSDVTSAVGETDPVANAQGQQLLLPFLDFGNGLTTYANAIEDFSWEYVWHCHLLGHEEADMMRPQVMQLDNNGFAGQPAVPEPAGIRLGIQ
jgi:FtsP/CotA-like multicopper oxidase with cupredoxin domain